VRLWRRLDRFNTAPAGFPAAKVGGRVAPAFEGENRASVRASREGLALFVDRIDRRTVIGVSASS